MQASVEDISSVKKILHIEIPEQDVTAEVNKAYKELNKTAKIKGFRPGKIPRQVLENRFKKDVNAEITSKFIQDSFAETIKENNFNVVGTPQIEPPELEYKKPYKFDAVIELYPVLNHVDFKGLELKKNLYKATDQEIDIQLKAIQRNQAELVKIEEDRPAQKDDYILIDYEGFKDGEPFEDAQKTENFTMKIGASQISKELDDNITGMKPGDTKEIAVTFPEDYSNKKIAGMTISFQVTLKEIRKEILPEINDEFAKKLGPFADLDALKKEIANNLVQGYEKRTEQELSEQIFSALLEKQDFEVPDIMISAELDGIITDIERSYSYHNISLENMGITRDMLKEKYRDVAVKQVKRHILLNQIVIDEKLELSDNEIEKGIQDMAASFKQPVSEVKEFLKTNSGDLENLKFALLEKKALNLIIENSSIEEVEMEVEMENKDSN
ncbi:Trigger factor [Desulfonema limicola]|uniref:Trigger factor n=1 Tax=Desulfonema limicola TaxID=45656 RepID=A0A975BEP6_9BACT|nr:trigger factor [Desulfonema limicola]QTA83740.1 Trigger factor [Desulfonema limicola]